MIEAAKKAGHHLSMAQSQVVVDVVLIAAVVLILYLLARMAGIAGRKKAAGSQRSNPYRSR